MATLCACGGRVASGGGEASATSDAELETSEGSDTSGPSETDGSDEPDPDLPGEDDPPPTEDCWTATRTGHSISAMRVDAEGLVAVGSDELWFEKLGVIEHAYMSDIVVGGFAQLAGSGEDLWLVNSSGPGASGQLYHWDAATLEDSDTQWGWINKVVETPDGQLWRGRWSANTSAPMTVYAFEQGGWLEQVDLELHAGELMGDDVALWAVSNEGSMLETRTLARRVGAQPWVFGEVPRAPQSDSRGFSLAADGSGGLFMLEPSSCLSEGPARLSLINPDGSWTSTELALPCTPTLLVVNGQAVVHASQTGDAWRWGGAGEAELVAHFDRPLQLAGGAGRVVGASANIELFEVDLDAGGALTPIAEHLSVNAGIGGGGGSLDGSLLASDNRLLRWSAGAWTEVAELPPDAVIRAMWAESPTRAWALRDTAEGRELWRWDESEGETIWPGDGLEQVWGRGPSDVWVSGGGELRRFDGQAWATVAELDERVLAFGGVVGAPEHTYVLTDAGRVWRHDPRGFEPVTEALDEQLLSAQLVVVGSEGTHFFARVEVPPNGPPNEKTLSWDGQQWVEFEVLWPELYNISGLTSDREGGAYMMAIGTMFHWEGDGWTDIDLSETPYYRAGVVSATSEGILLVDSMQTHLFRWKCD